MSLSKEAKDIGSVPSNICPVTGLPITRRPEWTDVSFGKDYKLTVSILGDSIVLNQPSGYVTLQDAENTLRFSSKVVTEIITGGRPYVHISDYSNLQGASFEARKYYIDNMKKRERLLGLIFCGTSSMFKMSIKLGKRLNIVKFNVQIVNDYSEAVKLAIKMLSHGKIREDKPIIVSPHDKNLIRDTLPTEKESICPVTGLPITTKPEWTDIDIAENYSVSFSLIGNAILCTVPNGIPSNTGTHRLLEEREKVLREVDLLDKRYAEIRDHSKLSGRPSKESRMMLTNLLLKEANEGNLLGFWVFNAPLFIRLMLDVGTKLHKSSSPVAAVKDYKTAIDNAVNVLDQNGIDFGTRQYKRFAKDGWGLELENYGIRFELIENDIIYTIAHGALKEAYVEKFFKLHEKVLDETSLTAKGCYYRIINWEKLEKSTWKARRMYIDGLKNLNKRVHCKFSVLFGLNKFMSTIVGISKQFVPIPMATAKNLEEALTIIEREKNKETETKITKKGKKPPKKTFTEKQIRKYSEELLEFMGAINWDQEGVSPENISDSHPFKPVFDAIAIIKGDLDDLFQERKQAEESLRESEEKYRTILESIDEIYFEVDISGNFTFFNDSLPKSLGYSKDELMGMNNRDYMTPESSKKIFNLFNQIYKTGNHIKKVDYEIIRKDGSHGIHEMFASMIKDKSGQPIGFRGIAHDITELKKAEDALRDSEEKYRTILESIEEGYAELDISGNFNFVNDAACKILGYPKDELIGMNNRDYMDEESAKNVYQIFSKIYRTGKPSKAFDYEIIRKNGSKGHVEFSASLRKDSKGQPIGFRGVSRDITERKRAEALQQAKFEAEAANLAKSDFLAKMSHEMRTPLNGIIGMAELAMDTDLDDNQRNILSTINIEANSLLGLISDVLDFSKIEVGKVELEEIPFDLRILIEEVTNSMALRAEQKGLEFISFLSPDVPSLLIGDPGRMRQILKNLASNAVKFTHEGEIYINVEVAEDLGDRAKIRFLVKDTGIGIPKDKQAAIFESFTQADGSTTRKYGGTGLGTTISKQLVELMGGEIGVESPTDFGLRIADFGLEDNSEIQKRENLQSSIVNRQSKGGPGSTFYFTVVFSKQIGEKAILPKEDVDLSGLRVLVVDDSQTNRFILMEYLRSWGCGPVETPSGKEALSILRKSVSSKDPFNLILTDIQMPEMSGFDLATEIRTSEALKKIPIIALTSVGMIGDGKRCRDTGIDGYLTKPIKQDDLHKSIISVLSSSMAEAQIAPKLVTKHSIVEEHRKGVQILLVEDYPTNQQVAMRHLQGAGYQVDLAENGQQAVEAYKRKHYDIILMDIQMPVMDGYEATKAIRKLETRNSEGQVSSIKHPVSSVPIIAMTAHATKADREKAFEAGMDDYVTKPLRRTKLLATVEKWSMTISDFGLRNADYEIKDSNKNKSKIKNQKSAIRNPQSAIEKVAPMNFEKAIEEFEGDKEFLMEVLEGFLDNVRAQIETIHQAISNGDAEVVWKEAHSIKGGAANLTADKMSKIAFELEKVGKSGTLEEGGEVLERLKKEFYRLENFARGIDG